MLHRSAWIVLFIGALIITPVCVRGSDSVPKDLLSDYYGASTNEGLEAAIDRIVQSDVDAATVAQLLRDGPQYSADVPTGWTVYEFDGPDGRTRPYHVYVPTGYDPSQSYTLLFDLHGAVSVAPQTAEYLMQRRRLWEPEAEANGWILVVPQGDRLADWFSADGLINIMGELDFVKHLYNVDENRIFVSGFSDGGSGAFWQAFHNTTPWAGFISFHGHPAIGGYGPYQTYPRNLLNRPIRATSGADDELYPADDIDPYMELFNAIGVALEWVVYPGGHDVQFLDEEAPLTVAFIERTQRNPHASEVVWETSSTEIGRCDWVRIDEIANVGNNEDFEDINLAEVPDQIVFGASLAYHGGTLFTVAGLEPGSAAHLMGIKNGDQILRIDDLPVLTQQDIGAAMVGKEPGDPVEVELVRDGETIVLTGIIPAADLIYTRNAPTASIRATADGNSIDVSVSHVGHYTLFISSEQFDLSQPITVTTNGDVTFSGIVQPDLRFMLEQAAQDFDRTTVYEAKIGIDVPAGG